MIYPGNYYKNLVAHGSSVKTNIVIKGACAGVNVFSNSSAPALTL